MKPYQQRVIEERKDLREKIDKLSDFVGNHLDKVRSEAEVSLLHAQLNAMRAYAFILAARMSVWKFQDQHPPEGVDGDK